MALFGKSDSTIKSLIQESKRCANLYHELVETYDRGYAPTASRSGAGLNCTVSFDRVRVSREKPKPDTKKEDVPNTAGA